MTDKLDDISVAIGRLQAQMESGREERRTMMGKIDGIAIKLDRIPALASRIEAAEERLDTVEPEVEKIKKARWMGIGAAAVIGGGGASVWTFFRDFFGGGQ